MTPFERDLCAAGYEHGAEEFCSLVVGVFAAGFPHQMDLTLPSYAHGTRFCNAVRALADAPSLPDQLIEQALHQPPHRRTWKNRFSDN